MLIPFVIFILLALGYGFRNHSWWILLCLTGLAVFIGYRDLSVGTDSPSYYDMYHWAGEGGYNGYPEILYGYAEVIFYRLGASFWEFQFILFFISGLLIWKVVKKWSPNGAFSIFIYYGLYLVMYATNATRQIFAVTLVLWAYSFLVQGKKWHFAAIVLTACGFHISSCLAFTALLVNKINLKSNKFIFLTVIGSLIIGVFMPVSLLTKLAGDYGHYLENVSGSGLRSETRLVSAFLLSFFWSTLLLILSLCTDKNIKNNFWLKMYYVAILVNNICMRAEQGLRIVWIFSIAEIIALPIIVKHSKLSREIVVPIIYCYLAIFFFTLLGTNSADVCPYRSILINYNY